MKTLGAFAQGALWWCARSLDALVSVQLSVPPKGPDYTHQPTFLRFTALTVVGVTLGFLC